MYNILTLNNISQKGLVKLPQDSFNISEDTAQPDAILLRSFDMHNMDIAATLKAVGRAGAGVNNIPIDKMSAAGVVVFNAPGANANAVKELVIAGMLIACRNLCYAWEHTQGLRGEDAAIHKEVENVKKKYVGFELPGKTLGVIGLGAIGIKVANAALAMGMKVVGYDPQITVQGAWKLSSAVDQAESIEELFAQADFISFHVPLVAETKNMVNAESIKTIKDGAVLLNFARAGIVDETVVTGAIASGKLHAYVCDFPSNELIGKQGVITLPHLGASTKEAEENCAIMVAEQIKDFLENGNVRNSVNMPEVKMARNGGSRLAIVNSNVPNMVGQISTAMADASLNIVDLLNKSKGDMAYTLIDVEGDIPDTVVATIKSIDGVLSVRVV